MVFWLLFSSFFAGSKDRESLSKDQREQRIRYHCIYSDGVVVECTEKFKFFCFVVFL